MRLHVWFTNSKRDDARQELVFKGVCLKDSSKLSEAGVRDGDFMIVISNKGQRKETGLKRRLAVHSRGAFFMSTNGIHCLLADYIIYLMLGYDDLYFEYRLVRH